MDQSESVFWKTIFLSVLFFVLTPITIGVSLFALVNLSHIQKQQEVAAQIAQANEPPKGVQIFASLPEFVPKVSAEAGAADARPEIIRQYLARYNSPLEPHAKFIVETADKYDLDFRLITAIAQQESNLCKFIPPGGYNCWGWGIHSRGTLGFQSFEEGIETVSKGLRENYLNKGFITAEEIMSKYTPSSPGTWARGVNIFMADME